MKTQFTAILTHVPDSFFQDNDITYEGFTRFYMSRSELDEPVFYHFIAAIPTQDVLHAYICWGGRVRVRANVLEFRRNQPLELPHYSHPRPRHWMVTCGPVAGAPREIPMKGFRGFRYCEALF